MLREDKCGRDSNYKPLLDGQQHQHDGVQTSWADGASAGKELLLNSYAISNSTKLSDNQLMAQREMEMISKQSWADMVDKDNDWQVTSMKKKKKEKFKPMLTSNRPQTRSRS